MKFELELHNNNPMVSSLNIAAVFDREHSHVMTSITNIGEIISHDDIVASTYTDTRGKSQPLILLNERAALIAMPFIGGEKSKEGQVALVDAYLAYRNAKKPTFQPPLIGLKSDEAQASMLVAQIINQDLRLPESGRLLTFQRALEPLKLTHILPNYGVDQSATYTKGSSQPTHAATYLLKEHGIKLSAVAFNKLCIAAGILETKERPSTKTPGKMKLYKSITEMGLKYGKNLTTQKNQRETSPHWFDHLFGELIDLIME